MLPVRDIMTRDVLTVTPDTTLRDASELLARRHVGGAPVISGDRVVGVVSANDILSFLASTPGVPRERETPDDWSEAGERVEDDAAEAEGDEPHARFYTDLWEDAGAPASARFSEPTHAEWDLLAEHTVAEAMTFRVCAVPPLTDVAVAAERMRSEDVHRLLVMEAGKLLGVVTTTDLARAVADGRVVRRTFVFDRSHVERDHDGGSF